MTVVENTADSLALIESNLLEYLTVMFLPVLCGIAGPVHGPLQFPAHAFLIVFGRKFNENCPLRRRVEVRTSHVDVVDSMSVFWKVIVTKTLGNS